MAGVRVEGLNKVLRDLKKFGVQADDLKEVMYGIGNTVVNDAKALTPVRTGALQNSLRASKAQRTAVIRGGSAKVPYASFVEFGSVHNTPEEMVRTAIEKNQDYAARKLDEELQSLARRYGLD